MPAQPANIKIGGYMLASILLMFDTTTAILFIPPVVAQIAGRDGWMAPLITIPAAVYIVLVTVKLGSLFPGKTIIEYLPLVLGKVLGKIVAWGYLLFLFYLVATVLREAMALLYGTGIFRQTPVQAAALLLVLATTYATASGLESISRTIWYYCVFIVLAYTLYLLGAVPFMNFNELLPVGEAGFNTIMKSTLTPHAYRGELVIIAFLYPYIKNHKEALLGSLSAIALISFFITASIVACMTIMGVEVTSRVYYSAFFLADYIPTSGLKIVFVTIWVIALWGKLTIGQFLITIGMAQVCGFKDYRPLTISVGIMLLVFAEVFYSNTTEMFLSVPATFPGIALFFEYLIPGLLLLIAWLKIKASRGVSPNAPAET
ncbi:MAG: endospore germination permease [Syntrophomonadaceae bacterium]